VRVQCQGTLTYVLAGHSTESRNTYLRTCGSTALRQGTLIYVLVQCQGTLTYVLAGHSTMSRNTYLCASLKSRNTCLRTCGSMAPCQETTLQMQSHKRYLSGGVNHFIFFMTSAYFISQTEEVHSIALIL
jgi:hypothetical protein